jgi:glycerophosphoryl diester phosphodiesterase
MIYAHRGANREAPENSLSAFNSALNYAIDGIETDVQLTLDEVPVLWHDRFLSKIPGLESRHVDDFKYAELSAMDFAAHFGTGTPAESIVRLQEFIDTYRRRCRLLLEIKNRDWEDRERHHIKVRKTLDMAGDAQGDTVLVSSFNLDSLIYANQYRPGFPLVYNFEPDQTVAEAETVLQTYPFLHGLCLPKESLDESFVALLRGKGKSIAVYTCNSSAEINKALHLGVDILISDLPQKALRLRDA